MLSEKDYDRARGVNEMFGRIATRYDFMNSLMSFGRDRAWRRFLVTEAEVKNGGRILDVGTGTGDIAFEALRINPENIIVGADFTMEMMRVGQSRPGGGRVKFCQADALKLPFPDATFDAVTSGFLVRNVIDIGAAFEEQVRVVKPGGRVVCLDTSPVPRNILRPFVMFHLNVLIPFFGYLFTRQRDAYRYLPRSTMGFKTPEELADIMARAGLKEVTFRRFMFGNIALHSGVRSH